jgi:alkylation response protein AidB-like acyl-CoA dehydrogenase
MDFETLKEDGTVTPLTVFSEEEQLFRSTIREFAEEQIRPLVSKMDKDGEADPTGARAAATSWPSWPLRKSREWMPP